MKREPKEADFFRGLEEQLLQPQTRKSVDELRDLLADEFVEFGSSGRVFDKAKTVDSLQQEQRLPQVQSAQRSVSDFSARWLARGVVLVTHQGTPTKGIGP